MLRLSCEQLQAKTPTSMRNIQEQKTGKFTIHSGIRLSGHVSFALSSYFYI